MSLRVSLVKVRQNLFISGESEPGSVPQAQPDIPIIRQYRTTQKYLNSGKQPFFTKLWQVMSMALAIRKRPKLCLVFFSKNITDTNPPKKPAINGMYFCLSSLTTRLRAHSSPRKMSTKLPTNSPKFTESLLASIFSSWVGDLNMRFMPKTVDSPHLIRQLKKAIRPLSRSTPSTHPRLCLQLPVLLHGIPNSPSSCPNWESGSSGRGG